MCPSLKRGPLLISNVFTSQKLDYSLVICHAIYWDSEQKTKYNFTRETYLTGFISGVACRASRLTVSTRGVVSGDPTGRNNSICKALLNFEMAGCGSRTPFLICIVHILGRPFFSPRINQSPYDATVLQLLMGISNTLFWIMFKSNFHLTSNHSSVQHWHTLVAKVLGGIWSDVTLWNTVLKLLIYYRLRMQFCTGFNNTIFFFSVFFVCKQSNKIQNVLIRVR